MKNLLFFSAAVESEERRHGLRSLPPPTDRPGVSRWLGRLQERKTFLERDETADVCGRSQRGGGREGEGEGQG